MQITNNNYFCRFGLLLSIISLSCCNKTKPAAEPSAFFFTLLPATAKIPTPYSEFRGVWLATVDNTDWPTQPELSTQQQQAELNLLLDRAAALHLNAILFQVRPACDALYQSKLEPWSPVLCGKMGQAPKPFYDPLAYAVSEAHRRGMELHAWINPFRVRSKKETAAPSPNYIRLLHPDWVRPYGTVEWLDPGLPAARDYCLAVINDIVRRYDIDGIHIDDYFYPYPDDKKPFPDDETYAKYGGHKTLGDWRRSNINDFVCRLYEQTKAAKPMVKVGISPFGIWRPRYPKQIDGFDAYDKIYADSRLWLNKGWADYFSPQLYWAIDRPAVSFPVLLSWWLDQNTRSRHVWPGLYTERAEGITTEWSPAEIEYQIKICRGTAGADGQVHFSASFLNPSTPGSDRLIDHLKTTVYQEQALVPATPWLATAGVDAPQAPTLLKIIASTQPAIELQWIALQEDQRHSQAALYVVQWAVKEQWHQTIVPADVCKAIIPQSDIRLVAVSAVDRTGRIGPADIMSVTRRTVIP